MPHHHRCIHCGKETIESRSGDTLSDSSVVGASLFPPSSAQHSPADAAPAASASAYRATLALLTREQLIDRLCAIELAQHHASTAMASPVTEEETADVRDSGHVKRQRICSDNNNLPSMAAVSSGSSLQASPTADADVEMKATENNASDATPARSTSAMGATSEPSTLSKREQKRRKHADSAAADAAARHEMSIAASSNAGPSTSSVAASAASSASHASSPATSFAPQPSIKQQDHHQGKKKKKKKSSASSSSLDWSRVHRRHIALKIMYVGTDYLGFAIQSNLEDLNSPTGRGRQSIGGGSSSDGSSAGTVRVDRSKSASSSSIEGELLRALLLTRLIPDRDAAHLSRCGRTDKGVHSAGQVIALVVRSSLSRGLGIVPKGWTGKEEKKQNNTKDDMCVGEGNGGAQGRDDDDATTPASPSTDPALLSATEQETMCARCGVPGLCFATDADCSNHDVELDYVRILNAVLPSTIRVIAWQPVPLSFSARFSCTARTYRYFFHADGLSLDRMRVAARKLIGSHDFRNFCRVDPTVNTHFTRFVSDIQIKLCSEVPEDCVQVTSVWPCTDGEWRKERRSRTSKIGSGRGSADAAVDATLEQPHPDTFCELIIHGNAFLYHQVRCMAGILFLVGRGVECEDLVERLLDPERTPNKPNYDMASELPLVLYDSHFPSLPHTPAFDYQTKPATNPNDWSSFVGQPDSATGDAKQVDESLKPESDPHMAASVSASSSVSFSSSSSSIPHAATSPSTSVLPLSSALNLYPSASLCLRNCELLFAHFNHLWRIDSVKLKVLELFMNQIARNMQSVRNECAKIDMDQAEKIRRDKATHNKVKEKKVVHAEAGVNSSSEASPYALPSIIPSFSLLLEATLTSRGIGLRPMSQSSSTYSSIFLRPMEPSYAEKVAALKGKKLERHVEVKELTERYRRKDGDYAPKTERTKIR